MFEAQRAANPDSPPELPVEGELLTGTRFSELSVLLAAHRFDHSVDGCQGRTLWPESDRARKGISSFSAPGLDHAS
jgi:hypothetical protein